jgi:hypothetical protein
VNDPNGCSSIDGRYHVFFQYNPEAPIHAGIKWGHMSSTDLVHWRQEPIALVNRPGELDEYGCWSGCVVDDAGVPTAVYSAVADDTHRSEVLLARSDRRMRTWRQDRKPVAPRTDDRSISHVRDPFGVTSPSARPGRGSRRPAGGPRPWPLLLRAPGAPRRRPYPAVGVVLGARPGTGRHPRRRVGRGAHVLPGPVPCRRDDRVPSGGRIGRAAPESPAAGARPAVHRRRVRRRAVPGHRPGGTVAGRRRRRAPGG